MGLPAALFVVLVLLISALRPALRRLYEEGTLPVDRLEPLGSVAGDG